MNETPANLMRPQVQAFYEALRSNDTNSVQSMLDNKFPLEWVQTFAETSLPEYAMSHGSVECAWLLMSHGVMPEKWSAFTGDAWKAFLKKGWEMATSPDGANLSVEAYRKIAKIGLKVTGQNFPSWMDKIMSDSAATATRVGTSVWGGVNRLWGRVVERLEAEAAAPVAPQQKPPIYVAPIKVNRIPASESPQVDAQKVVNRRAKVASKTTDKVTKVSKATKTVKPSKTAKPRKIG